MIVRIVKLTFRIEEIEAFKEIFQQTKEKIKAFPGVLYLELLQSVDDPRIFFTHSHWESVKELENYRHSELFKTTWAKTKVLFDSAPEAWSNHSLEELS